MTRVMVVFSLTADVKQQSVLFTRTPHWAMQNGGQGWKFCMCYCFGKFEAIFMSETLMEKLAYVGSCPHAGDTRVWANEIQPPQCLTLATQEAIVVTGNDVGQCWTQMIREVSCQLGPMEGQLWTRTSLIIYRPLRGASLPTKGFCVTGRFFSQFNFIFLLRFFYYTWCFFCLWPSDNPEGQLASFFAKCYV